jgi:hypothetical protein
MFFHAPGIGSLFHLQARSTVRLQWPLANSQPSA